MNYRISIPLFTSLGLAALLGSIGRSEVFVATVAGDAQPSVAAQLLAALKPNNLIPVPAELPTSDGRPTTEEIRRIASEAYVWGWPLVYVHNCRTPLEKLSAPGRCGGMPVAPLNQLSMLTDYISPKNTLVPCPNQDVVYGYGALDLAAEPVVLQVPDFGSRYWVYQLGDARTDGFAELGKMYDTKPGLYLIVGPTWQGELPAGFERVLRSPTRHGYVLPRVFLDDTAEDRRAIQPSLSGIMMYPLSLFRGEAKHTDWTRVRWVPKVGLAAGKGSRVAPETFFSVLAEVLDEVPPLAGEEARYAEMRRVLKRAKSDPSLEQLLRETAAETERTELAALFEFRNFGTKLPSHWTTISNGAAFGTDYRTRAAVAKSNVFVNRNNETKYYYQDLGVDGRRLHGGQAYSITFPAERLPTTRGFWSLTVYDDKHNFHANDLNRQSLGAKNKNLRYNADGSLTLYIQHRPPAAEKQANWLPAPSGEFSLYLRAYWPDDAMLSGSWTPPAVVHEEVRLAAGD